MDGLVLTGNLQIMLGGEVVGHLMALRVLECADGAQETEVVLHLVEPDDKASRFHGWREAGEELTPEKVPCTANREARSEVAFHCYSTTCKHCPEQPESGESIACTHADWEGCVAFDRDDDWTRGRFIHADEVDLTCRSYEEAGEEEDERQGVLFEGEQV